MISKLAFGYRYTVIAPQVIKQMMGYKLLGHMPRPITMTGE